MINIRLSTDAVSYKVSVKKVLEDGSLGVPFVDFTDLLKANFSKLQPGSLYELDVKSVGEFGKKSIGKSFPIRVATSKNLKSFLKHPNNSFIFIQLLKPREI